jgi:hypothetical protein
MAGERYHQVELKPVRVSVSTMLVKMPSFPGDLQSKGISGLVNEKCISGSAVTLISYQDCLYTGFINPEPND